MTDERHMPDGLLDPHAIDMLVVHCSDTPDDEHLRARDIQHMHLGFGWDGIGYHQVICRDGAREAGRPEYWRGAHARGANARSLSVCLIGRCHFTDAQMHSLGMLLDEWRERYPAARVLGHRDAVETDKTCPNFDVSTWWTARCQDIQADRRVVTAPVVAMTASPDSSALETELLFGETVRVLETAGRHSLVTLETDGYEGWIASQMTGPPAAPATHRIAVPGTYLLREADVTSPAVTRLSMGARIAVTGACGDWLSVQLPGGARAWVPALAACQLDAREADFVAVAERCRGVPYLWGGRSTAGLDCSALIQLALQAAGIDCPRNSGDQYEWVRSRQGSVSVDRRDTRRGDLIFWPGHVGICSAPTRFLHANAHHHAVAEEATSEALLRIDAAANAKGDILRLADYPC